MDLKPCPFCGKGAGHITDDGSDYAVDYYMCWNCFHPTAEEWNTRPIEDALQKRIVELEQEIGAWRYKYLRKATGQSEWIPINENLPSHPNWVIGQDRKGHVFPVYFYNGEWLEDSENRPLHSIVKWRELPEAEKEE